MHRSAHETGAAGRAREASAAHRLAREWLPVERAQDEQRAFGVPCLLQVDQPVVLEQRSPLRCVRVAPARPIATDIPERERARLDAQRVRCICLLYTSDAADE